MSGKTTVAQSVENAMRQMILEEYQAGERLPSESELSLRFSASRTSIREALKSLEASHVIYKLNGRNHVSDQASEVFVDPLHLLVHLNEVDNDDLQKVRYVLESEAAYQAALNADDEELVQLQDNVWLMQKPSLTLQEFIKYDYDTHTLVANASHNAFLALLVKDINTVLRQLYPTRCTIEFAQREAIPAMVEMVRCICARDAEGARENMAEHLRHSAELLVV